MFRWIVIFVLASAASLKAYGPSGHEIVGAIADQLLAKKPAGAQVSAIIDGITLERASTIPDEIKAWDKNGPNDLNAFPHYPDHPKIDQQLREFWRANPPTDDQNSAVPSHHWFHYTDVPVFRVEKYSDGEVGRNKWDIVHMIPYCVGVLRGEIPEENERKITKPVAVILLAHYVGDIHQPLHVGAEYFDQGGQEIDPDKAKPFLADEGGNSIRLHLSDDPAPHRGVHYKKLHGFWDMDAVNTLLPQFAPNTPKDQQKKETYDAIEKIAREMARSEPKNWRLPQNVELKKYAEAWADEILPIAREAHERLQFAEVHSEVDNAQTVAVGDATEKSEPDHVAYRQWASNVVRGELHKAGWRLADLLEKSLNKGTTQSASAPLASPAKVAAAAAEMPSAPVAQTPASPYGKFPDNYREIVSVWMKTKGIPPTTVDWQTEPKPADLPDPRGQHRYGYLVIFNTSSNGTGPKSHGILIHDGQVVSASGF